MSNALKSNAPIESAEAEKLLNCLAELPSLALAVSGGPDSMALLYLYQDWRKRHAISQKCTVLSVDHGLRIEAENECSEVSRLCSTLELDHKTLEWRGTKPKSNIQASARKARYELMNDSMQLLGVRHLVLAHHLDDQAETFLIRLSRGSGVYGLSAMSPRANYGKIVLLRPLLQIPKERLVATLKQVNWQWFEDPANKSEKNARGRIRKIMPEIAREGMTARRLADTARRLRRTADAINFAVGQLANIALIKHSAGPIRLEREPVRSAPEEVGLRLLACVISEIGGRLYVPRLKQVERLYQRLFQDQSGEFKSATVAGTMFFKTNAEAAYIWAHREIGRGIDSLSIAPGKQVDWDGRFNIDLSKDAPEKVTVMPLKDELDAIREWLVFPEDWPKRVFVATPVLRWTLKVDGMPSEPRNSACYFIQGFSQCTPAWLKIISNT